MNALVYLSALTLSQVAGQSIAFDPVGACSYSASSVTCWDVKGKISPSLSRQVESSLLAHPSFALSAKYKRKNRLLLVHRKPGAVLRYQLRGIGKLGPAVYAMNDQEIDLIPIATEQDQAICELSGWLVETANQSVGEINPQPGSRTQVGRQNVTLDRISSTDFYSSLLLDSRPRQISFVYFELSQPLRGKEAMIADLIDRNGKTMRVDRETTLWTPGVAGTESVLLSVVAERTLVFVTHQDLTLVKKIRLFEVSTTEATVGRFLLEPTN